MSLTVHIHQGENVWPLHGFSEGRLSKSQGVQILFYLTVNNTSVQSEWGQVWNSSTNFKTILIICFRKMLVCHKNKELCVQQEHFWKLSKILVLHKLKLHFHNFLHVIVIKHVTPVKKVLYLWVIMSEVCTLGGRWLCPQWCCWTERRTLQWTALVEGDTAA